MMNFCIESDHGLHIEAKSDKAEIFLYDQIGEDPWAGGGVSAKTFADQLRSVGNVSAIDLRLNSPGGNVFDADAIYNLLHQHRAKVTVYIDGIAASAASYVAMAGDTIKIAENAKVMVHNPHATMIVSGNAAFMRAEMTKMIERLDIVKDSMLAIYKARTGKTAEALSSMLDKESWFVGQGAVDAGFATEMIAAKKVNASFALLAKFKNTPEEDRQNAVDDMERDLMRMRLALARSA